MIYLFEIFLFLLLLPHRLIFIPIAFLLVFAASFISRRIIGDEYSREYLKTQPLYVKLISVCLIIRAAIIFYTRWQKSVIVYNISGALGISTEVFTLISMSVLSVLSFIGVLMMVAAARKLFKKYDLPSKTKLPSWLSKRPDGKFEPIICATILTLLFYISQSILTLWSTSDNYRISLILNGVYSDNDNYCIFMHHWITELVKLIDKIFPHADGFVLLSEVLILAGLWCIFHILTKNLRRFSTYIAFLCLCVVNYDINLLHMAFTLTAMSLSGLGFLLVYSYVKGKCRLPFAVVGGVLFVFGCLWRYSAHLMIFPFALLIIVADILHNCLNKTNQRRYLARLILCFVPLLILCYWTRGVSENFNRTSEKYKPGIRFNEYRSEMCDYPVADFDKVEAELSKFGITENDYMMAKSLILLDTDRIDTAFLKNLTKTTRQTPKGKWSVFIESGLSGTIGKMKSSISFYYTVFALYVFLIVTIMCTDTGPCRKLEVLFSVLGSIILILYFTYGGHVPGYLLKGLALCPWLIMFNVFVLDDITVGQVKFRKVVICMAIMLTLTFSFSNYIYFRIYTKPVTNTSLNAKDFPDEKIYASQKELGEIDDSEDAVYIWSVYQRNLVLYGEMYSDGKLVDREYLKHNLLDGEWTYSQPYFKDLMAETDVDNPVTALTDREHTYYIAPVERCRMVLQYIREHYDPDVAVEKVGIVHGFPVWKFIPEQ